MKPLFLFTLLILSERSIGQNVGIGIAAPTDKLHVNSAASQDALRVQVNGSTKLRVWANGGTTIGSLVNAPLNGLLVEGPIQPENGIVTPAKLVVESTGDSIIMKAGGSQVIIAANGNITIKSAPGAKIDIDSGGQLNLLSSGSINITAVGILSLTGSQIRLNGNTKQIARTGDAVGGGVITGGSTNVFTN